MAIYKETEKMKMSKSSKLIKILSLLVVITMFALAFYYYPKLTGPVPIHWNISGEVDRYTSPLEGMFMTPAIGLFILILSYILPRIDPKKNNYLQMSGVFSTIMFTVILFSLGLQLFIIASSLGYLKSGFNFVFVGLGLLFIVIGNYLPKLKPNYTLGIRTPWTLANEEVWVKTHRKNGPI